MVSRRRLDLHLHTTYSDGSLPPSEVVKRAGNARVLALSITDHDTLDGVPEAMEAGAALGIEVVPGIEISSRLGKTEVHILGYFLNAQHQGLLRELERIRETRHRRNAETIDKLNQLGVTVTYDEVRELAGPGSIGRPHIARVLMRKGIVQTAREAFERYLAEGAPAYAPRDLPDPAAAIALVRAAGGVPVLAHPSWVEDLGLEEICAHLQAVGLLGLEVYYSTHRREQTSRYRLLAERRHLLATGGSDFHGVTKPDIEVGIGRGSLQVPETLLPPLRQAAAAISSLP